LRLHSLTGNVDYLQRAERLLRLYQEGLAENPFGFANLLAAVDLSLRGPREIVVVARGGAEAAGSLLEPLRRCYIPNQILFCYDPAAPPPVLPPFARDKALVDSRPTAYVCRNFTCSPPATDWATVRGHIEERS
jgi:hypothetical protein